MISGSPQGFGGGAALRSWTSRRAGSLGGSDSRVLKYRCAPFKRLPAESLFWRLTISLSDLTADIANPVEQRAISRPIVHGVQIPNGEASGARPLSSGG